MQYQSLDKDWLFSHGPVGFAVLGQMDKDARVVNLPHDYMIESDPYPEAPSGPASGYYNAMTAHYTKYIDIPSEWADEKVYLSFDGSMMNTTVEVGGSKAALHHYGYSPFNVDITPFIYCGEKNRISITVNPSMQPNSRWYSGAGIFRCLRLAHCARLHLSQDGIYVYTDHIEYGEDGRPEYAVIRLEADIENETLRNLLADVKVEITPKDLHASTNSIKYKESDTLFTVDKKMYPDAAADAGGKKGSGSDAGFPIVRTTRIQINPGKTETAFMTVTIPTPLLWSADEPNLYTAKVTVTEVGEFRTHRTAPSSGADVMSDHDETSFGVRLISADVRKGLQINGTTVKLKGGCLHHDNGPLGAVSLPDAERRKIRKLKESGFNAIRTTHNPPSRALLDACDELGMYVFDEAFDAWGMAKQPGDYNMFFESDWEADLTAFVRRDRSRACVILWSTGNEIIEHGGLGNGYTIATALAKKLRSLDHSRPISNAICSYWSGLDDAKTAEALKLTAEQSAGQNADIAPGDGWEEFSEPFANGLDIFGYNYLEDRYEKNHAMYPDRVMLGSENSPKEIGFRWPMIEKTPYVIGDFTWTAWDYIGEAGLGKSIFTSKSDLSPDDVMAEMSSHTSKFPWRLANDADFDINGDIRPQGIYRRIVWGAEETAVFSYDPAVYGQTELLSQWGFTDVRKCWNWPGQEGAKVRIAVFSSADEVEVFVNEKSIGTKSKEDAPAELPKSFYFDTVYEPGTVKAVGKTNGKVVSEDILETVGAPAAIVLSSDRTSMPADGHALAYVSVSVVDAEGRLVPDAEVLLKASVAVMAEGNSKTGLTVKESSGLNLPEGENCASKIPGDESGRTDSSSNECAVLASFGSGNPKATENYQSGSFHTFRGRALAILRAGYTGGTVTLTVRAEGLNKAEATIKVNA